MQNKTEVRVGIFVLVAIGIFFFLTMHIGVLRFDRSNYKLYTVFFNDISGLEKKATVKIAGVDVGWVEHVELVSSEPYRAKAYIRVQNLYKLYADASAIVRQEGLLGTKYLEIIPGDPLLPALPDGHAMTKEGRGAASVDEIMTRFKGIAGNVSEITDSLKSALAGHEQANELKTLVHNIGLAAERIAAFSATLDRTLATNESHISSILVDLREFAHDMRSTIPHVSGDVRRVSQLLETEFLPSFQNSVEKVAHLFDNDIGKAAHQLELTTRAMQDTFEKAQDGIRNVNEITGRLNEGQGLIGKLLTDEAAYYDLKDAVGGLRNYFAKVDALAVVIDAHGEYMYRNAEHMNFRDSKGYFDVRIHPNEDHFYILQLVGSQKGSLRRKSILKNWYDEQGNQFLPSRFFEEQRFLGELVGRIDYIRRDLDQFKYGLQVGKIFKNMALRFGLFENSVGFGVDFEVPFDTDKFRWVTSLELFDFRGRDRINDPRPHFKWLNRLFLLRNIYMTFGADDFISRENANAFVGFGLRFADDDLKYIASKLGFIAG